MTLKAVVKITVSVIAFCGLLQSDGRTVTLSHGAWKGNVGYIAVEREAVQKKLDFYNANLAQSGGPLLFLPRNPVFPDVLNGTQHVLYVDFGNLTAFECDTFKSEDSKSCPSVSMPQSAMSIPLLADDPDGIPKYSLALNIFYPRSRFDVPNINIIFPYTPIDEVTIDDDGAIFRDGDEEIRVSVERDKIPCKPNPPAVRHEFEEFFNEELQLGILGPDFSYCDAFPNHHYCSMANSIKGEVLDWAPNVCQMGWGAPIAGSCQVSLSIVNITPGFRRHWLLGRNDSVNFIASESYDQEFDLTAKFPCVSVEKETQNAKKNIE